MGGHTRDIKGVAEIKNGQGTYIKYIKDFEGVFNDPTCRITFKNNGNSISVKELEACSYYQGMAATFDRTYYK